MSQDSREKFGVKSQWGGGKKERKERKDMLRAGRHQSIISVNLKAEGEPEKGVACLLHIFPQFVFNTYSLPSKGEKEGAYTILKRSKLLLVSFRMISAKETSSGTE